nr:hypothetical protein [Mycobacterium uberis]
MLTEVTRIFALHCDSRLKVGKIAVRHGSITSETESLEIMLYSTGGHMPRPPT